MTRSRNASARAVRYPSRWPAVLGWSAGALVAAGLVIAIGMLAGSEPDFPLLKAAAGPAVAAVLIAAVLLHLAWCVRHLILHWLAWRPGQIEVATFTAGTPLTAADVEQLTLAFRRRLMTLHLQAPAPAVGAAPEGDFLDVLGRSGMDSGKPLAWLVGLLRAAKPTHAYEVRGVLLEREQRPRYGVAVQVVRMPCSGTPPVTVWGETWDVALRQAADEATAVILPQTRRCRSPWGVWRGYAMPQGLLHAYEEGARLEHERRYDEALDAYWRAVEHDPLNMVLRLRIGQLQERLGLYLDALATYLGMEATSSPAGARREDRVRGRHGRHERREALQAARYRRNVLLGGRVLAKQWLAPPEPAGPTLRDRQRARLRGCLRPHLVERLSFGSRRLAEWALGEPAGADEQRFLILRELLAAYALRDCRALRRDLRRHVLTRTRPSIATVKLTELCIGLRLDWIRKQRDRPGTQWPPQPEAIDARIRAIRTLHPLRHWHEHYNAACAYALALLDQTGGGGTCRSTLAARAVAWLERATAHADSAYIAGRRDWLLSEDPDLKGLRGTHEFERFELLYLPSDGVTPRRPRNVQQLESCRYVRDLLVATARIRQATWRARRAQAAERPDIAAVREWFADERAAWEGVRDVATHYRHPRTRFTFIRGLRTHAERCGLPGADVPFPRYDEAPLTVPGEDERACDDACAAAVERADDRLGQVAELLGAPSGAVLGELRRWEERLRDLDAAGRPAPPYELARVCEHHGALWQRLGEWLGSEDGTRAALDALVAEQPPSLHVVAQPAAA
ncbi:hypothetical protein [Candidatus Solirubrobacter pratensis]|uniref:hypothetical protein n=1 Tax=Candidatus Solirubrobacter pratensis TaxID=1298857 RepID=UPI0012DEED36|nr:hypothetical protein [Candidatus Solirubrobacter pratensis]